MLPTENYLSLLPANHASQPRYTAFLTSLLTQVRDLSTLPDARLASPSFSSSGATLDTLGSLLSLPRNGLADEAYRLALRSRVLHRFWTGTLPHLRTLLTTLYPDLPITVRESSPLTLTVEIPASYEPILKELPETALPVPKPLGVNVIYVYT